MRTLWQDFRFGFRMLAKNPGFTAVAVATLALGIGVNTAIFSLVNAALLRPLPVKDPEQLTSVLFVRKDGRTTGSHAYPNYKYFREHDTVFSGIISHGSVSLSWRSGPETDERIHGQLVSGNYFEVLGVRAVRGRTFLPEEDRTLGTHPVVVLAHDFWRQRLGSDPDVVGSDITLNGHDFTVVGVAPLGFHGTDVLGPPEVWVPMMMQPAARPGEQHRTRRHGWLQVIGRLREGVSLDQAQANLQVLWGQIEQEFYQGESRGRILLEPTKGLAVHYRAPARSMSALLMAVVGLVLLIACSNVANLLLARAAARSREMAVRVALGAGRMRLVRQLLVESMMLSVLGGTVGFLVAVPVKNWLSVAIGAFPYPLHLDLSSDSRVFGFAAVVSLLTVMLFGLVPALRGARTDVTPALKGGASVHRSRRFNLKNTLVVAEVTLCLVLLIAAGLFVRSLGNAHSIDIGFNPDKLIVMSYDLNLHGYDAGRGLAFSEQVLERVRTMPGVRSATLAHDLPLDFDGTGVFLVRESPNSREDDTAYRVGIAAVMPAYFQTMGVRLLEGRDFSDHDAESQPRVAVVNQTLAQQTWPGEDPLGKRFNLPGLSEQIEVIGIAQDGKYNSRGEQPTPFLYLPLRQMFREDLTLIARTAGDPGSMISPVRQQIRDIDRTVAVFKAQTMTDHLGLTLFLPRTGAFFLSAFGALALFLAAIGLYGVISYAVSQRTQEVGVRVALGARRKDVLQMVIGQGFKFVVVGLTIGIAVAVGLTRFLSSFLYDVSPTDPITFAAVCGIFGLVALLACYVPARRATKIDPMMALRYE